MTIVTKPGTAASGPSYGRSEQATSTQKPPKPPWLLTVASSASIHDRDPVSSEVGYNCLTRNLRNLDLTLKPLMLPKMQHHQRTAEND